MNGGDKELSFDTALGAFVRLVAEHLGSPAVDAHRFIRDVDGRLSLLLLGDVDIEKTRSLRTDAENALGAYASASVVETPSDLLDPSLETAFAVGEKVNLGTHSDPQWHRVPVVDQRIVGQDWASEPHVRQKGTPPIVTFHGVKGGVGRSTALAVAAVAQAKKRRNVLVVDLDLEAPGIATLLLAQDDLPELGIIDWLVETNLHPAETALDERYVAPSRLTAGRGAIDVLPALGKCASRAPWGVVPKLGRAFVDQPESGLSFMHRIRHLIELVRESGPHRYDVVLVDARAGLAETTAAALIGLGAHNLCFGIDTPPSHDGFRYLFSYLAGLAHADQDDVHWAENFRIVHAKALPGNDARRAFRERVYDVFVDEVYDRPTDDGTINAFSFDYDDEDAPHWPWPIAFDATFAEFDPGQDFDRLGGEFAERAFGSFLSRLNALIANATSSGVR